MLLFHSPRTQAKRLLVHPENPDAVKFSYQKPVARPGVALRKSSAQHLPHLYKFVYIYTYMYTYICLYLYIYIYIYTHLKMYVYVCVYIYMSVDIYRFVHILTDL